MVVLGFQWKDSWTPCSILFVDRSNIVEQAIYGRREMAKKKPKPVFREKGKEK